MIRKQEAFDEERFWGGQADAATPTSPKPTRSRRKVASV
jgi:hypothetical protein